MSRLKKYLITVVVQLLLIAGYAIGNFYAFKAEKVVLNPGKYLLPVAVALIVIDAVIVFFIFKNSKKTNEVKNHEGKNNKPANNDKPGNNEQKDEGQKGKDIKDKESESEKSEI